MTDTQALVERLRAFAQISRMCGTFTDNPHNAAFMTAEAADALERLSGERAAIVAWLRAVDWCSESRSYANAFAEQIEQGLHHRAQALADLAEGDAE